MEPFWLYTLYSGQTGQKAQPLPLPPDPSETGRESPTDHLCSALLTSRRHILSTRYSASPTPRRRIWVDALNFLSLPAGRMVSFVSRGHRRDIAGGKGLSSWSWVLTGQTPTVWAVYLHRHPAPAVPSGQQHLPAQQMAVVYLCISR